MDYPHEDDINDAKNTTNEINNDAIKDTYKDILNELFSDISTTYPNPADQEKYGDQELTDVLMVIYRKELTSLYSEIKDRVDMLQAKALELYLEGDEDPDETYFTEKMSEQLDYIC